MFESINQTENKIINKAKDVIKKLQESCGITC